MGIVGNDSVFEYLLIRKHPGANEAVQHRCAQEKLHSCLVSLSSEHRWNLVRVGHTKLLSDIEAEEGYVGDWEKDWQTSSE